MSLLWNLDIFFCIRLEEKDLFWILPTWNLNFLIQAEQTTALLWKSCTSWTSMWSYSSEFFWVILPESTPAKKNMFKINGKKHTHTHTHTHTLELLQLMWFECLYNWYGIYFSTLWRSLFFSKTSGLFYRLHTYNMFVQVYYRVQNTRFHKKQV